MRNYLVLQELLDESKDRFILVIIHLAVLIVVGIIAGVIDLIVGNRDPLVLIITSIFSSPVWIIVLIYFLKRRSKMERAVALEAMGEYREAMEIASKFAKPSLLAKFHATYKFEINKSNASNVNSNQTLQPIGVAQINSTNHNSANPTIHIHNTQTQQGPNRNYIQDSVVTDWNQR